MFRYTAGIVPASVVEVDGIVTIASANGVRAGSGVVKVVVQILASGSVGLGSATIDLYHTATAKHFEKARHLGELSFL